MENKELPKKDVERQGDVRLPTKPAKDPVPAKTPEYATEKGRTMKA